MPRGPRGEIRPADVIGKCRKSQAICIATDLIWFEVCPRFVADSALEGTGYDLLVRGRVKLVVGRRRQPNRTARRRRCRCASVTFDHSYDQYRIGLKRRQRFVGKVGRDACALVKCSGGAAILTIEWIDRDQRHAQTLYRNPTHRE